MNIQLNEAIQIIVNGGIVIYPTDTAFGIGCRIDDEQAVKRLYTIRKRDKKKAVPVLVDSPAMAMRYFRSPSNIVRHLMEEYWPGALTIVFYAREDSVPSLVRGGASTVGLRMPDHVIPLTLISNLQIPILGPSANFAGKNTPFCFEDLDPELVKLVDYVVAGVCRFQAVSTVVDCTSSKIQVVRQGAIIIDTNDSQSINKHIIQPSNLQLNNNK